MNIKRNQLQASLFYTYKEGRQTRPTDIPQIIMKAIKSRKTLHIIYKEQTCMQHVVKRSV
jgi:hypothetical protein